MADTIRILIVEDSPVDAGLVERALHESLESCEFRQVDTRQDYLRAIETFQPHLIVTDYTMPQFDGMTALKLAQQHAPLTPVIIWTSSINEDIAVQCMKAGATNYVLKDNIKRLGPAVLHALEEKKVLLERRQAEDKLRESEEKYRSIVETTTEWIWEMDLNGRHTFSNRGVTAILGYRLEELIGQTAVSLLHAEDRSEVETTLPRLVAEKRGWRGWTLRWRHKDGSYRFLESNAEPILDLSGNVRGYRGADRDITERQRAEAALRESEARYRAISELVSDYTFSARVESDGRIVPQWVAGAFQQITGYSWEEFIALGSWPQIVYPDDWPNDQLDLEALLENRPINRELRIVTKSGEVRWILNSVRPVWNDQQGRVTELIGAVRDISERKQAEEALRESEQKFRGIVEQASDGIVLTDEHGNVVEWNRAQERITQLSARDVIGQPLWDIQFQVATPDRNTAILREQIKASTLECLQSGQAPWLNQLTEQVIQRPDGTHRNVQSLVFPITMRTGFLLGSVIRDITERKRAEQALRESEFQYRTTLEAMGEAIHVVDRDLRFVLFNPAFIAWNQELHLPTEVLGEDLFEVFPFLPESVRKEYSRVFQTGEILITEDRTQLGGQEILTETRKIPIFREGKVFQVLTVINNITERKRAEEKVKELNQELAALNRAGQAMTSTLDLNTVLGVVMKEVRDLMDAEGASVLLQEGDELVFVAAAGPGSDTLVGMRMPATAGIAGWVMQAGKAVLVGEARSDPRFYDRVDAATGLTTRSLLAVPLMVRGAPRGVIEATNKTAHTFDEHDLELLEGIASPAAIAIENARLFAAVDKELIERERAEAEVKKLNRDLERRAVELTALNKAGQAIVSTLDLDTVLGLVLAEVQSLLEVQVSAVFLRVPAPGGGGDELLLAAFRPGGQTAIGMRLPITTGITGSIMQSGQPVPINDAPNDPHFNKRIGEVAGIVANSLLGVPLVFKGAVEGVIVAANKTAGAFDQHDLEMLEVIAHSAATAIKNAQLYAHLEKALQQELKTRAQLIQAGKLGAMGRMVASVAHEFNNPLQTIKNCLFLVQETMAPTVEEHRFLNMAASEVERLSNLVAQLRAVYRPAAGDQMQAVELSKILEQVRSLVAPHLLKDRVQWEYAEPPYPLTVRGIADQLKQVFLNLSLNASDAMQAEGGTLTVSLATTTDGRQAGVTFRDTGPGIDPQDLPNLFDPFFTTKETGTGLGLAISYDIVQKHSGRIEVESQPGQGATFTVWLPLASP